MTAAVVATVVVGVVAVVAVVAVALSLSYQSSCALNPRPSSAAVAAYLPQSSGDPAGPLVLDASPPGAPDSSEPPTGWTWPLDVYYPNVGLHHRLQQPGCRPSHSSCCCWHSLRGHSMFVPFVLVAAVAVRVALLVAS